MISRICPIRKRKEQLMAKEAREQWSGNWGFLMSLAGSAIGLGNIWKFPYITGVYGGGAFVLLYLGCIALVGLPITICELTLGRASGKNPIAAYATLAAPRSTWTEAIAGLLLLTGAVLITFEHYGVGFLTIILGLFALWKGWRFMGFICGVLPPFLILAYYGVVGGWTIIYIVRALSGQLNFAAPEDAIAAFSTLESPQGRYCLYAIAGQLGFMVLCGAVVWAGVKRGIERWSKILMPMLFALVAILILRGISLPDAARGLKFFLYPDFSKLNAEAFLVALGHAFFTLSLGMGITIVYGSYLKKDTDIVRSSLQLIGLDTLIAMMAGVAIFPVVFAMGFEPAAGPGLTFHILPTAFNLLPGGLGAMWNTMFFLALAIAALTSGVSLLEVVVSAILDSSDMRRHHAVLLSVAAISLVGMVVAVSVSNWEHVPGVDALFMHIFSFSGASMFDFLDQISSNWLLPLSGFVSAVFVGWVWGIDKAMAEIREGAGSELDESAIVLLAGLHRDERYRRGGIFHLSPAILFGIFVRLVTPILVLVTFLNAIGVIKLV